MPIHFSLHRFIGLATALALSCASLSCAAAAAPAPRVASPVMEPLPMNLVSAVQKPNGSRIAVRYHIDGGALANQPAVITLIFDAVTEASATARFTSDSGLQLSGAAASVSLPKGSSQFTLQAIPQSEGLFYVNVFTTQAGATSVISVPIQTGAASPKLRKLGETKPAANGERIISMPVR